MLLVSTLAGCDARIGVYGAVVDDTGAPVQDAQVYVHDEGLLSELQMRYELTAADGSFGIGGSVAPSSDPLVLIVKKTGFETHTEELERNSVIEGHKIVLKRQNPPDEGGTSNPER